MHRLFRFATGRYSYSYLLKNARIVNADVSTIGDVLLEHGKITAVAENLSHKTA